MLVFILPDYFSYFVSTNLPYELYRRHCPEKKMTSKCHNAFLHVIRAYKTRCVCLKLFKRWTEPIEAYHPYRQSVIIFCVFYDDAVAMVTV